jgi:hypothetical protein
VSNTSSLHNSTHLARLRFSIALPPTLPRNGRTPTGRLMYWLVGTIEGLPDGKDRLKPDIRPSSSNIRPSSSNSGNSAPASSSSNQSPTTSALPSYSNAGSDSSDVEWLRGSVQSERRIAVSHNPNPEGGVTRLDDDFTHNLSEFGTCRIQTRVNEVDQYRLAELMILVVYGLPLSITLHMPSPLPARNIIRYSRETRRNSHHHTAIDRQAHRHQTIVHHH